MAVLPPCQGCSCCWSHLQFLWLRECIQHLLHTDCWIEGLTHIYPHWHISHHYFYKNCFTVVFLSSVSGTMLVVKELSGLWRFGEILRNRLGGLSPLVWLQIIFYRTIGINFLSLQGLIMSKNPCFSWGSFHYFELFKCVSVQFCLSLLLKNLCISGHYFIPVTLFCVCVFLLFRD